MALIFGDSFSFFSLFLSCTVSGCLVGPESRQVMLICFFGGVFLGPVCVCVRFPTAGLARPRKKRSVFFIFFLVGRLESSKLIVGVCVLFLGFFFVSASLSIYRNSRVRPLSMRLLAFIYFFWFIFNRIFGNRNPTLPPSARPQATTMKCLENSIFFSLKKNHGKSNDFDSGRDQVPYRMLPGFCFVFTEFLIGCSPIGTGSLSSGTQFLFLFIPVNGCRFLLRTGTGRLSLPSFTEFYRVFFGGFCGAPAE